MKDIILQDVLDYILTCKDINKLREIKGACKDRGKAMASHLKYELQPGDKVKITGSGKISEGIIKRVNRTRAIVMVNDVGWDVPFTMITKED